MSSGNESREPARKLRVLLICTGVGVMNRGIETFAIECFKGLRLDPRLELRLAATRIEATEDIVHVWSASRDSALADLLGRLIRRNPYVAEQLSSLVPVIALIREFKPDVVFTSEANLTYQLFRWRRWIGHPFRLLFSNGGPCGPEFPRMDFIHQVAPFYTDLSLALGDPPARHITVPYGISVPPEPPFLREEEKTLLRRELGLPDGRPILLSVGSIDSHHKRMDYLISEVARLPHPRPFLVILGHQGDGSAPIIAQARELLREEDYRIRSVSYAEVTKYYRVADQFVLCSLKEGFGRVFLEAAMHGLPVIAHQHPVIEYVVGSTGQCIDLSRAGSLADHLHRHSAQKWDARAAKSRWETVRQRFDWTCLRDPYVAMFRHAATTSLPWL